MKERFSNVLAWLGLAALMACSAVTADEFDYGEAGGCAFYYEELGSREFTDMLHKFAEQQGVNAQSGAEGYRIGEEYWEGYWGAMWVSERMKPEWGEAGVLDMARLVVGGCDQFVTEAMRALNP